MRILLSIGIVFLLGISAKAQTWHKGSVTLMDRQVFSGDISVDTQYDLVLVKTAEGVDVHPAYRVHSARIHDQKKNINRRFVSMKSRLHPRMSELFEIVISGEISVLRSELTQYTTTEEHERLGYAYYVLFEDEMIDLRSFNPKVYSKLKTADEALALFIKHHRLNPNSEQNAVQIIQYYNQQAASAQVVRK